MAACLVHLTKNATFQHFSFVQKPDMIAHVMDQVF